MPMRFKDKIEGTITNADYASSAGSVAWGNVTGKPSTFAPSTHTHNYAGSGSAGGSANSAVKLDTATAGSTTQPVYFSGGKPVVIGYTIQSNVPANAKFTDTNTTYDVFAAATASAAGGTGLVPAPAAGQQNYFLRGDGTWQTLSKSTVGLGNVDNTADSAKSVKYATSAGSANSVAWDNVTGKPSTFAPSEHTHNYAGSASAGGSATSAVAVVDYGNTSKTIKIGYNGDGISGDSIKFIAGYTTGDGANVSAKIKDVSKDALKSWLGLGSAAYTESSSYAASSHTHNYAGSDSAGGSANSAVKLDTATAGSTTQPVYFSGGKPVVIGYTIQSNVPANAKFTDTNTTYDVFKAATASAAGGTGLVPAPSAGQQNYFLRGDGTWQALSKSSVGLGNVDNTADSAKSVKYATSAGSANSVAWGNVTGKPSTFAPASHTHKYASGFSVSGTTVTVSYGDGSSSTFTTQDTNNTYNVFTGATASAAGCTGLVPVPAKGQQGYYLAGDATWKAFSKSTVGLGNVDNTADSAKSVKYATSAGSANSVAWDNVTGKPSTFAPSEHTHNYAGSASAGGSATSAVAVVDYGNTSKTIKIGYNGDGISGDSIKFIAGYTTGDGANVSAKIKDVSKDALKSWLGLGSAAYTESSSYAASSHTHNYAGSDSAGGSANSAVKLDTATAGSTTQPVYFSGGKPVVIGYTIQSNVPANAKFTDTNTTYDVFKAATASAAGGTGLVPAPSAGQQNYFLRGDGTWQALSKSSVGLGNVDNTADSAKSVKYATSAGSANSVAWGNVTGKPSTFAPSEHTHNYAGSASAGGSATSAVAVVDYNSTSKKTIQIGWSGSGINGDDIKFIAGYTTGDEANVCAKIKDVSKDALKAWLGLGSAAYTESSNYAASSHTHKYASGFSVSGTTVTVSYGDGSSSTFTTQDTNNTYDVFKAATASAAGGTGLVPAPSAGQQNYFLRGDGTWQALSKSSVGLGNVDNTADSAKSVKYATSAGSANSVAWDNVTGKPSTFAPSEHTHNYAGSASAGGSATSAVSVVDYNNASRTIKIGYDGASISGDNIKYIAGYTTGDGANVSAKIKDVTKDALKSWLGLGSAAYTESSSYAASSHTLTLADRVSGTVVTCTAIPTT